jgi:hypothetical protein
VSLLLAVASPVLAADPADIPPAPPLPVREEPTLIQKTGDVLFVRPLLAVRFVVNVAAFPVAWPVAAVLGDPGWAVDACLVAPTERLFERPLGRL